MITQDREKLTYQYMVALDEGDMDAVARILTRAEQDPELERMILEMNDALIADDSNTQLTTTQKETTMPVFKPTKRKRGVHTRWTAVAAIVASLLFIPLAVFIFTDTSVDSYSAEAIPIEPPIDKADLTRQFLSAWNDNDSFRLFGLLTDDYRHRELGMDAMPARLIVTDGQAHDDLSASVQVVHHVAIGNTPFGIANQYGISVEMLAEANGITIDDLRQISVGQELVIPLIDADTNELILSSDIPQDEVEPSHLIGINGRIANLNAHFTEIHFFISDINTNATQLYATLTLKGLHRNVAGQEITYTTTGFINVTFEDALISETVFTINTEDFVRRYGQHEVEDLPESNDLFVLPPDDFDDTPQSQIIDINDSAIRGMSLNIDAGHVDLRMGSLPDTVLIGDIANIGAYEYVEKGERIKIISIDNHPYYLLNDNGDVPIWFFKIGEGVRTDLDVVIGNRDAMLDLTNVNLQGMTLTMGAGTASLNLPYTGTNYHVTVTMLSSLAKLELNYPVKIGLRIDAYDGIWQSRNYNHAETVINLQLNGSLSALDMLDN